MAGAESIGLSGLLTSQRLLDLAGQNISNAGTPGYHRQVATLAVRSSGGEVGTGVEITHLRRVLDHTLEQAITRNTFSLHDLSTQLTTMRQIEVHLQPGEGSLVDLFEKLRNQVVTLAGKPDDAAGQRVLFHLGDALAEKINSVSTELAQVRGDVNTRLENNLTVVNGLARQIAEFNKQFARSTSQGLDVNTPSDQRDQLINQLAAQIDVRVVPQSNGTVNIFAGSVPLVVNDRHLTLRMTIDDRDQAQVRPDGYPGPLDVTGGEVHGLLVLRNSSLKEITERINIWSQELVKTLDSIQATGLGLTGAFHILHGQRAVDNVNLPLNNAGLAFPPVAGSLHITMTNQATGLRTLHTIAIDPDTQGLNDLAAAVSAIPNLQGVVNTQSRTLTIVAQPGYSFDFAGRLPSAPESIAMSGSSTPGIGGQYSGSQNDQLTFTVVGSGTVGVTPDLKLEARNGAGQLVGTVNIGQGYEPDASHAIYQGVTIRLGSGTVNNGDSFSTRVIAHPDTAGLLPALGINSFYQGDTSGILQVRPDLLSRPELLAGSRTGLPADGGNWNRLAAQLDARTLGGGKTTLREHMTGLVSDIGGRVQSLDQRESALASLAEGLEAERQSISGVDPNEELMRMLQYQRSFQLSAKFLTVISETLQELMQLV